MENFKNAGSEQNLKNIFNNIFFNGQAQLEQDKIDIVSDYITFETKYKNNEVSIPEMYAQLIATHKKHNVPFKKYLGVFNENNISFMESDQIQKRLEFVNDINWKSITPSHLNDDIKSEIIKDVIPNNYETVEFNKDNFEHIRNILTCIQLNKELKEKEEISDEELKKTLTNVNERFHKIKSLKDTDRSLFFSAIMIALNESYPIYTLDTERKIYENKIQDLSSNLTKEEREINKTRYNREAVSHISNAIIETIDKLIKSKINNESKQRWKNQFIFIQDLEIDMYEYINIILLINNKLFKSFKAGQKQDILGKAYKIFLSRAGKIDNKNIILTPDHIKNLMVKLANLNKDDVVLDTCMGTGGFLMEAMEFMAKLPGVNKDNLYSRQLIGSDSDPKLFVLACSNMFLHGDGRSQLYDKDTIHDDIIFNNGNGFFNYIKSLKPTKCIINPPYEDSNCFDFTKQGLDFLEDGGKLIVIIKENTFQKINNNIKDLLKYNTLDFYIKMPTNLFSEQNRSVSTAIFGWTKGIPHPNNKYVKFYNLDDDGFENIPHNGRIDTKHIWKIKEEQIIEYIINDMDIVDSNIAYKEKIFDAANNLLPIYHHFREESAPVCIEDFEETVFDYFLYEQTNEVRPKIIKEISNRDIKKFIIRELKNGKD